MKVSINTQTGLIIESQADAADDAILRNNAAAIGIFGVDVRIVTDAEHDALIAAREIVNKTPEQLSKDIEKALDKYIDDTAKADGWDSRITCALRAGYPGPWQAKAIKFFGWMEGCYVQAYQIQADVIAGNRPLPTPEQVISELPPMVW